MMKHDTASGPCACGSGHSYQDCCQALIEQGITAASAEALMRSRYTAYAIGAIDYLLDSWHPTTRPTTLQPDAAQKWIRLKLLDSGDGFVEFVATCRIQGRAHKLHEKSRFLHEDGRWLYVDGEQIED